MISWQIFVRDFRQWFLKNKIWGNFKLKIGQKVFERFSEIIFRKRKLGNFVAWFCKNILLEDSSNKFRETKNRETSSIIGFDKCFFERWFLRVKVDGLFRHQFGRKKLRWEQFQTFERIWRLADANSICKNFWDDIFKTFWDVSKFQVGTCFQISQKKLWASACAQSPWVNLKYQTWSAETLKIIFGRKVPQENNLYTLSDTNPLLHSEMR